MASRASKLEIRGHENIRSGRPTKRMEAASVRIRSTFRDAGVVDGNTDGDFRLRSVDGRLHHRHAPLPLQRLLRRVRPAPRIHPRRRNPPYRLEGLWQVRPLLRQAVRGGDKPAGDPGGGHVGVDGVRQGADDEVRVRLHGRGVFVWPLLDGRASALPEATALGEDLEAIRREVAAVVRLDIMVSQAIPPAIKHTTRSGRKCR